MENLILEKSKLFNIIESLVVEEVNNSEFRQYINTIFYEKKLNNNVVSCLFNNSREMKSFRTIEQIAIAKACYEYKEKSDSYDYKKYFSKSEIDSFEDYEGLDEESNIMEFNNFLKVDDNLYRGNKSYIDIASYYERMLYIYNVDTQRANSFKKIAGKMIRKPSVDKKTVNSIRESILSGTFEDTEIILNVRLVEGKSPRFEFIPKYDDVLGDILIEPQYTNKEDERYTEVNILDGYHRILAIKSAVDYYYQETGNELEGSIGVKIVFADNERALRIVDQTFKRSSTDKQFLGAIKTNNYTILTDDIIKKSKELRGNVAKTYDECVAFGKITHKYILNKVAEYLEIKSGSINDRNFQSKKYAKLIDEYIDVVKYEFEDDDISKFINPNIFAGVIAYGKGYFDRNKDVEYDELYNLAAMISNLKSEDIKKMRLMNKNCSIPKIVEFFGGVTK